MKLLEEEITVRDTQFVVKELTVKQMMPMLNMMADDPQEGTAAIVAQSVNVDGKPVGKALDDYPASVYMQLVAVVTRVNNLDSPEEKKN